MGDGGSVIINYRYNSLTNSPQAKIDICLRSLRRLLGFAVGSLLGDVFLHVLPESYEALAASGKNTHEGHLTLGLWILGKNLNQTSRGSS